MQRVHTNTHNRQQNVINWENWELPMAFSTSILISVGSHVYGVSAHSIHSIESDVLIGSMKNTIQIEQKTYLFCSDLLNPAA